MAIVYVNMQNGFNPISYNGSILPYGITMPKLHFTDEEVVSPPCSPRAEGEVEYRPRIIFNSPEHGFILRQYFDLSTKEMKMRQNKFTKYPSKKNMTKYFRRSGKLKQPGGASCNQRR